MTPLPWFPVPVLLLSLPGAGPVEPCALITRAEATAALGVPSDTARPDRARDPSACRWASADDEKYAFVRIVQAGDLTRARSFGGKLVPGIGDEAVWSFGALFIRKGATCVQLGLYLGESSMKAMDPELITLAKAVAGRM